MSDDDFRVPAAGTDPDSRQRLAKTMVASGFAPDDLPEGLSTDAPTDADRADAVREMNDVENRRLERLEESGDDTARADAAAARKAAAQQQAVMDARAGAEQTVADDAGESKVSGKNTPPQGRSAKPSTSAKTDK